MIQNLNETDEVLYKVKKKWFRSHHPIVNHLPITNYENQLYLYHRFVEIHPKTTLSVFVQYANLHFLFLSFKDHRKMLSNE